MSFSTDLRNGAAQIARDVLAVIGETWTYSNRGAAGISVYVEPGADSRDLARKMGLDDEQTARRLFIPYHTAVTFPPSNGIAIDDTLTQPTTNYIYFIKRWESDPTGAGFVVDTVREQVRRIGS